MNRTELLNLHQALCGQARELMEAKNQDYAQESSVFGNLDLCEHVVGVPTEVGILIRMADKLKRLGNYYQNGGFAVSDEGLKDTILDIINYSVLEYAKHLSREESKRELPNANG